MDIKFEKSFVKALASAKALRHSSNRRSHGMEKRYGKSDWISKDGKWTITGSEGTYRIDNRHTASTYMVKVSMSGNRQWLMGARTTGPHITEPKLPRHVKAALEKMIAKPPLTVGVYGMKIRGEDAQYVMREMANATRRIDELQRAPLSERKEAAAEWLDVMKKNPEIVGERVSWLLDGAYGRGEYEKALQIYEAPRMNRVAALSQLIAAYEWQTPPREAVAAWKKLTASEKQALEKAIQKAINQHGRND